MSAPYLFCDSCRKTGKLPPGDGKPRPRYRCSKCNEYLRIIAGPIVATVVTERAKSSAIADVLQSTPVAHSIVDASAEQHNSYPSYVFARPNRSRRLAFGLFAIVVMFGSLAAWIQSSEEERRAQTRVADQVPAEELRAEQTLATSTESSITTNPPPASTSKKDLSQYKDADKHKDKFREPEILFVRDDASLQAAKEQLRTSDPKLRHEGFRKLARVAESGNADAYFLLGKCLDTGCGTALDHEAALKWWKKGTERKQLDCMAEMAHRYITGTGVEQDISKGRQLLDVACKGKNGDALNYMANFVYAGKYGIPKDERKARELYTESASLGSELGILYMFGLCCSDKKYDKAIRYLKIGDSLGQTGSMMFLAHCYWNGQIVAKDDKEAIRLLTKAGDLGHATAYAALLALLIEREKSGPAYIDYELAIKFVKKAVVLGSKEGIALLAELYEYGWGVERDHEKAIELMLLAKHLGADVSNLRVAIEKNNRRMLIATNGAFAALSPEERKALAVAALSIIAFSADSLSQSPETPQEFQNRMSAAYEDRENFYRKYPDQRPD